MSDDSMAELEAVVEQLIERCQSLQQQNLRLINTHEQWMEERRRLFSKFENAENCIDQTLAKLKSAKARS